MALYSRWNGVQNQCYSMALVDNTGAPKTGLSNTTSGLIISTWADGETAATVYSQAAGTIDAITTLGTYAAPAAAHCRFAQKDATNHPGLYELQFSNSRFAVANAGYLDITIQCPGSAVPAQYMKFDLGAQVDVHAVGGTLAPSAAGVLGVNVAQIGGDVGSVTKLLLELKNRVTGTITNATFTPTTTAFECSDIADSATFPIYINRGYLITAGAMIKGVGTILFDQVGTSGRRFTVAALPQAPANLDTLLICG